MVLQRLKKGIFYFMWMTFEIASFPIRLITTLSVYLMRYYTRTTIALFSNIVDEQEKREEYEKKVIAMNVDVLGVMIPVKGRLVFQKKEEP